MKFQAPAGVTAIVCGGEAFSPDENGCFLAEENLAVDLAPHGCVAFIDGAAEEKDRQNRPRKRVDADKAN